MNNCLKLIVAAVLLCAFAACSKQKTQVQEKIIPVKIMEITASQTASEKMYVGTVEESVGVSLSFSGTGTVEQVLVSEGQLVTKGQLLATLNTTTMQNAYDASLAKLAQAQDAYDRLAKVHESGSLPDIKFVEVETGLQQAKSMVAISKKSLDDCKMYAPSDGAIAFRNIEVGTNAMPGIAAFRLLTVDKVNIKFPVPENEIGRIQIGQEASVVVSALNNAVFTGKIEIKGVSANVLSHTYEVKIGIMNNMKSKNILLPGMVCKVFLAGETGTPAFVIPDNAIQISPDGRCFVWLAKDSTACRCFVKPGNLTNDGIIVTEGLQAGNKIIVEGFQKISEGMKISITD
ncbi:MAG: efflux RND transporter periplasmic adaptor subunit [Candidatus Azobacteroides sp.]|nr:efflux RND transporter periplasmic adaptor subunit [Candidatus Azobacteroides sp.]